MERNRRIHSVHHTREEAVKAANELGWLMNGVPWGYGFYVLERMGKFAFISQRLGR